MVSQGTATEQKSWMRFKALKVHLPVGSVCKQISLGKMLSKLETCANLDLLHLTLALVGSTLHLGSSVASVASCASIKSSSTRELNMNMN